MRVLYTLFGVLIAFSGFGQGLEAKNMLESIKARQLAITSYEADVLVHVDVDFIKIPDKNIHVIYQAPDHFDVKAEGFVLLPKNGLRQFLTELLGHEYLALSAGETELRNQTVAIIKVIPSSPESKYVLATLWIAPEKQNILKADIHTKEKGSFQLEMFYQDDNAYGLPSESVISFDVSRFSLPLRFLGKMNVNPKSIKEQERIKGSVTLTYSDLKVEGKE